jgi:hypothetical protein
MLERNLEARCVQFAKGTGCWALKLWPTVTGIPDRLVLMPKGRVWFVEFKTPQGKLSKRQEIVIAALRGMGFQVDVVRDFQTFAEMLDKLRL